MLDIKQLDELIKRAKSTVYTKYPKLSYDQSEDLIQAVIIQGSSWKNPENKSDPVPEHNLLQYMAYCQISHKSTGIFNNQVIEDENRTDDRSEEDFNFNGEKSDFDSKFYQNCSYEFLQEEAGWEPEQDSYEQILINNHEENEINKRINNQIFAFTSNYHIPKHLRDAIKHIKAGGELHAYAVAIGISDQTLANQLQNALKTLNHAQLSLFKVDAEEVATIVKLEVAEPVKAVRRAYSKNSKNSRRVLDEGQRPLDF